VVFEISDGTRDMGRVVIELEAQRAPETAQNFLRYVDEGFYNGTVFHRVLKDFMIQGGGYRTTRQRITEGLHPPVRCEARNGLKNQRGTIAAARAKDPQSATSQFFINLVDNPNLDHPGHDGWGYCVFGHVVEGMEIMDRISELPTRVPPDLQRANIKARRDNPSAPQPESSQPMNPPKITKAYRLPPADQAQLMTTLPAVPQVATPAATQEADETPPDAGEEYVPPAEEQEPPPEEQPPAEDPAR
jgi:cyclophilin family peptidyl-prolyl cis-trans isomerase